MGFESIMRATASAATGSVSVEHACATKQLAICEVFDAVPRIDDVATYTASAGSESVTSLKVTLQSELRGEVRDEVLRRLMGHKGPAGVPQPSLGALARSLLPGAPFVERLRNLGASFRVRVDNSGDHAIQLLMGDVLQGGYCDRVVAADVLLAPRSNQDIAAFCIEGGRNTGDSSSLTYAGLMATPTLRRKLVHSSQTELWATIAEDLRRFGFAVPCASYRQLAAHPDVVAATAACHHLRPTEWANGAIGIGLRVGGEIEYADTFHSASAFSRARGRLTSAYCRDAAMRTLAGQAGALRIEPLVDTVAVSHLDRHTAANAPHHSFLYQ